MNIFNQLGSFGPIILFVFSLYFLWEKHNLFFYYNIGVFADQILNIILKGLLQCPRPSENLKLFNLALKHNHRFIFKNGIPYDIFGMPSGHAESVAFSTTFIFLSTKKHTILYIYLFIALITIWQRVEYNYHTIAQVVIGSIVGTGTGYLFYNIAREKIKCEIKEKKDDDAPI
jgi:membrane-associated phospholipid phosphatase